MGVRVLAASVAASSQRHRKSTSIIRVANGTRDAAKGGSRDGRSTGQNEQLKFIDMQKFTSFWFGFSATQAKLILILCVLCFCFHSGNPHGCVPRKLLPFLGFALFVCHMSLFILLILTLCLSLSLTYTVSLSFSLSLLPSIVLTCE